MRLKDLGLPGAERIQNMLGSITEIIKGDASDATFRLGKPDAELYVNLQWARKVHDSLANKNIEKTIRTVRQMQESINNLPAIPALDSLKTDSDVQFAVAEQVLISDEFYEKIPDLNGVLTQLRTSVESACQAFELQENAKIDAEIAKIQNRPSYALLTDEQREVMGLRFSNAHITNKSGMQGIRRSTMLATGYTIPTAPSPKRLTSWQANQVCRRLSLSQRR